MSWRTGGVRVMSRDLTASRPVHAAIALTAAWLLVLASPASLKPLMSVLAGVITGAIVLALSAGRPLPLAPSARRVLAALGLGLAALLLGAVLSAAPGVSIFGAVGQHNGWLLWAAAALWFAVGTQTGRGRPFRALIWSVTILGGVVALSALLDALGLIRTVRYSTEVAGLLESSVSLGQMMVLGIGAAVACALSERRTGWRSAAWAIAAVETAALGISSARGAQLVVIAGALVAALWMSGDRLRPVTRRVAWVIVVIGLGAAVCAVGVIAYLGPTGAPAALSTALNVRPTIWHAAWVHIPEHLLIGAGPDQFSAVFDASISSGYLQWQTSSSPHNVLLDWMLGGGLVALLGMLGALGFAGRGIVVKLRDTARPLRVLGVALGAWAVSLLASWTDPLSAIVAAVLAGAILAGDGMPSATLRWRWTAASAVIVVVASITLVFGAQLWDLERQWWDARNTGKGELGDLTDRWQRWPDPAYGGDALTAALSGLPSTASAAGPLAGEALRRMPWDANAALVSMEIAATLDRVQPTVSHPGVTEAIDAGRAADPASPIWDELKAYLPAK